MKNIVVVITLFFGLLISSLSAELLSLDDFSPVPTDANKFTHLDTGKSWVIRPSTNPKEEYVASRVIAWIVEQAGVNLTAPVYDFVTNGNGDVLIGYEEVEGSETFAMLRKNEDEWADMVDNVTFNESVIITLLASIIVGDNSISTLDQYAVDDDGVVYRSHLEKAFSLSNKYPNAALVDGALRSLVGLDYDYSEELFRVLEIMAKINWNGAFDVFEESFLEAHEILSDTSILYQEFVSHWQSFHFNRNKDYAVEFPKYRIQYMGERARYLIRIRDTLE